MTMHDLDTADEDDEDEDEDYNCSNDADEEHKSSEGEEEEEESRGVAFIELLNNDDDQIAVYHFPTSLV